MVRKILNLGGPVFLGLGLVALLLLISSSSGSVRAADPPREGIFTTTARWANGDNAAMAVASYQPLTFLSPMTSYMAIPTGVGKLVQPKIFNLRHGTPTEVDWSNHGILWRQVPNAVGWEGFSFAYEGLKAAGEFPLARFRTNKVVTEEFTTTMSSCETYGGDGPGWICLRSYMGLCFETFWYRFNPSNICITTQYSVTPIVTSEPGSSVILESESSGPTYADTQAGMNHLFGEPILFLPDGRAPTYLNPWVKEGDELVFGLYIMGDTQVFDPTPEWGRLIITPGRSLDLSWLVIQVQADQWYPESRRYWGPVPGTPMTFAVSGGTLIGPNVRYPGGAWPAPWVEEFKVNLVPGWNNISITVATELPFPVQANRPLSIYYAKGYLPIVFK